ncbi:MAG TPA: hypothetical protein DIT43_02075 [Dehalococcoidia bacterium]|nr:hypothetical protein [Dehalococcoidia bacterium]
MKKSLVVITVLTLSLLLAAGCGGGTPTSTETPTSTTTPDELVLEITEPADESVVDVSRITVSGSTLADAVVSINGVIADVDYQGIFTDEVNLDAGPNVIEVVASDFYGNEKSAILTVIYATALPLTVSEPLNDSVVTLQTVTVRGATNADATVSVNGKIVSVDESGNFSEPVNLDLGPNLIEVLASDFYGNSATVTITVIYSP